MLSLKRTSATGAARAMLSAKVCRFFGARRLCHVRQDVISFTEELVPGRGLLGGTTVGVREGGDVEEEGSCRK